MNFLELKTTFETEFNTWYSAVAGGGDPVFWENVSFNQNTSFYVVPRVIPASSTKIEFGRCGGVRVAGNFVVRVVGRVQLGAGSVMTKADLINNHFSDYKFSNVHTEPGNIQVIGVEENRYQVSVIIPFSAYQEARS